MTTPNTLTPNQAAAQLAWALCEGEEFTAVTAAKFVGYRSIKGGWGLLCNISLAIPITDQVPGHRGFWMSLERAARVYGQESPASAEVDVPVPVTSHT